MAAAFSHDSVCFVLQVSTVKVKRELIPHREAGLVSRVLFFLKIPREFCCQMEYKISPSTLLMAGLLFQSASSTVCIGKETYQDALTTPFSSSLV